jgi:hypothetical protein
VLTLEVFESAGIIVYHFAKARQEQVSFTTGVGFFDLFTLFQKYLGKYCTILQGKLKSYAKEEEREIGGSRNDCVFLLFNLLICLFNSFVHLFSDPLLLSTSHPLVWLRV